MLRNLFWSITPQVTPPLPFGLHPQWANQQSLSKINGLPPACNTLTGTLRHSNNLFFFPCKTLILTFWNWVFSPTLDAGHKASITDATNGLLGACSSTGRFPADSQRQAWVGLEGHVHLWQQFFPFTFSFVIQIALQQMINRNECYLMHY